MDSCIVLVVAWSLLLILLIITSVGMYMMCQCVILTVKPVLKGHHAIGPLNSGLYREV